MTDSNFKVANIITVAYLDQELNLQTIFDLLTILPNNFKIGTKIPGMNRETVPFFGINGAIVGLKYGKEMRGIDRPCGHLESLIGVDLQCFNKNINLKVSHNKIQLTGAKSEQMAIDATLLLLKHFDMLMSHYKHVKSLSNEVQINTIEWLISNLLYISENNLCVRSYDTAQDKFENLPPKLDIHMAKWLAMYACEFQKINDGRAFIDKIYRVISHIRSETLPFTKVPEMISYKICNGVYNFSLGKKISLIQASQAMIKEGYKVSYHNWSPGKKMKIAVSIENISESTSPPDEDISSDEDTVSVTSEDAIFSDKKIKAHRFTINQSGSIRQMSPTSFTQAYDNYFSIYTALMRVVTEV